jgi:hypothetical protein
MTTSFDIISTFFFTNHNSYDATYPDVVTSTLNRPQQRGLWLPQRCWRYLKLSWCDHMPTGLGRAVSFTGWVESVHVRIQYSDKHLGTVYCNCRHLFHFRALSSSSVFFYTIFLMPNKILLSVSEMAIKNLWQLLWSSFATVQSYFRSAVCVHEKNTAKVTEK